MVKFNEIHNMYAFVGVLPIFNIFIMVKKKQSAPHLKGNSSSSEKGAISFPSKYHNPILRVGAESS